MDSKGPRERCVWAGSIFPGPAVMTMHKETKVPGGLILCCKVAVMSSLYGESDVCIVWRRYRGSTVSSRERRRDQSQETL